MPGFEPVMPGFASDDVFFTAWGELFGDAADVPLATTADETAAEANDFGTVLNACMPSPDGDETGKKADLEKENAELVEKVRTLEAKNEELGEEVQTLEAENARLKKGKRTHDQAEQGHQQTGMLFSCRYCKRKKWSNSCNAQDGRVRIRCECGGKNNDGKPRQHAKWDLVTQSQ
jgi:hypothetical protein